MSERKSQYFDLGHERKLLFQILTRISQNSVDGDALIIHTGAKTSNLIFTHTS